jgi:hypothetical protein
MYFSTINSGEPKKICLNFTKPDVENFWKKFS